MKNMVHVRYLFLTMAFGLFAVIQASAQMKIGNNPTQIHPASILELESGNQALRLTEGDTASVNATLLTLESVSPGDTTSADGKAAEGLIMYQTMDHSIYMRIGGYWQRVVSGSQVDSTFWKVKGNLGTDSATSFLGTLDKQALNIGANNTGYIIIHSNGIVNVLADSSYFANNAGFGKSVTIADTLSAENGAFRVSDSIYVGKPLAIHDSIVIAGLQRALTTDSLVLVMGSGGIVRKMNIDSIGIRSINGVSGTFFHLRFGQDSTKKGPWIDSTSLGGFSTLILNIPDASPDVRGLVNDSTQAFGGAKSFVDSVAIGTSAKPNATLDVLGNVNMATHVINSSATTYDMAGTPANSLYRTIVFDVSGWPTTNSVAVTLPDATKYNGRIYTIKKVGTASDNQLGDKVVISPSGGQTFEDGGTSYTIYNNFSSVTIQAQSGKWYIISKQ